MNKRTGPYKVEISKNTTPAMRQFLNIKEDHPDEILFFRMGDFYEMFFEDAKLASKLLGITLTSRSKDKEIPMCGVPYHSAKSYIAKLIKDGYKVALCEQVEDPAEAKGLVERAVTSVITPGVALDDDFLEPGTNNFIAAVSVNKKIAGLSFMDVLTGEFRVIEFNNLNELNDELQKINAREVVVAEGSSFPPKNSNGAASLMDAPFKKLSYMGAYDFTSDVALTRLTKKFNVLSMDGFGCNDMTEGLKAAGALLHYVTESQKTELAHVDKLTPYDLGNYLTLDHTSRRNLEITENIRTRGKADTLLGLLDRTRSPMGLRLLFSWLTYPLTDVDEINKRLDGVGELVEDKLTRSALQEALDGVYDLERLTGRVSLGVANPRDLVSLKLSLMKVPEIRELVSKFSSSFLSGLGAMLDEVKEATTLIDEAINDAPPISLKDGSVIKDGFRAEVDELREIGSGGKESIARLEAKERERTGISTLKVGYNRVFGYYLSVPRTKTANIPEEYIRKQTLVNAERYITPELKEFETRVLEAQDQLLELENTLFAEVREVVAGFSERIRTTASVLATLDAALSLAEVSESQDYVRPEVNESPLIEIKEGRHPVIEGSTKATGTEGFVPNDIRIDSTDDQIHIITGPNMAGKSTFMRQVALIVLMAQIGSYVPAKSASIGVVDRIFTRVGASDDLSRGQSTFMVEMNETANILNNATDKSLIILDEIGRGTSTFDGLSIAWAVAEFLHDTQGRRAKTLFATHYHELTELSLTKERVKNYNISVKDYNGRIIFLRKVVSGGASRSYGIQVAKLAGLPDDVVTRAGELLKNLESGELDEAGKPRFISKGDKTALEESQPSLPNIFSHEGPLKEHLKSIDLDKTAPIDALKELYKLKEIVDS